MIVMKRLLFLSSLAIGLLVGVSCQKTPNGNTSETYYPDNDAEMQGAAAQVL